MNTNLARLAVVLGIMGTGAWTAGSGLSAAETQTQTESRTDKAADSFGSGQAATADDAAKAWKEVLKALRPPAPPEAWQTRPHTEQEVQDYHKRMAEASEQAAAKAKDFYTRFPNHPRAAEAKRKEAEMLRTAERMGNTEVTARLAVIDAARAKDPSVPEEERLRLRAAQIEEQARAKAAGGQEAVALEMEQGARTLIAEFPKQTLPYQLLLSAARDLPGERGTKIIEETRDNPAAPEHVRESAKALLHSHEILGRPLALKFTALDGRSVDVEKMRGKVVLVDFWATWCGPCVGELPHVRDAYEKLHPRGFEIVGISFDQNKEALSSFVEKEHMPWPQFFDGAGWGNQFGREFGINAIPTMWLVDKKGLLRDQEARGGLEQKVEKLLAEPTP